MGTLRSAVLLTILLTLTGCTLAPVYTGNRTVTLRVATPLGATAGGRGVLGANLETLRVEVTGAGFAKVDTVISPTSPGVYDAKVTVPVGKGRTFTVTARDAAGKGYAAGTTVADLTQPTATVAVTLAPVTAGAPVVTTPGYTADFTGLATGEVARVVFEPVVATTQGFQATLVDAALAVVNAAGAVVARGTTGWTMGNGGSVVLLYTKTGAAPSLSVGTMAGTPVLYDANGADSGAVPVDPGLYNPGDTVTVLGSGTLVKAGYQLAGWMTAADGSGSSYAPTSTFAQPTGAVTLHAVWVPEYLTVQDGIAEVWVNGRTAGMPSLVTIPEGVTCIVDCFNGATWLTSVNLPTSLLELGPDTFRGCTNLTSIILPPRMIRIGEGLINGRVFQDCTSLTTVNLPSSITKIPAQSFQNCVKLTNIDLSHVTFIWPSAFSGCVELKTVTIPLVTEITDQTFAMSGLTSVSAPNVLKVDAYAFSGCSFLTSISIPKVTSIGHASFGKTGILSFTIPASLTTLDATAFSDSSLTTLTLESPTPPPVTGGTLGLPSTNPGFTIRVPAAGLTAYQTGPNGWSDYAAYYVAY